MQSADRACGLSGAEQPDQHGTVRRWLVLVGAVCASMALLTADGMTHSVDLDCEDFETQTAAQNHRNDHPSDPDRLDDAEGRTCPGLPCPCGATELPPAAPVPVRPAPAAALASSATTQARVTAVVDAATLRVRLPAGNAVDVRLIGVGSSKQRGSGSPAACGGADATARIRRLAFRNGVGRRVRLTSDPAQAHADRSGRRLAYVDSGGVDFGHTLILSGWAEVDVRSGDFLRLRGYREAQRAARAAGRGAWRRCGS